MNLLLDEPINLRGTSEYKLILVYIKIRQKHV